MVGRPFWRSRSGRKALLAVQELSGCPPGGPGVVETNSQLFGSCREDLKMLREWSGGPFGGAEVVERHSCRSGSGRETLPEVRN